MRTWNWIASAAVIGLLASCVGRGEPEQWNVVEHQQDYFDRQILAVGPSGGASLLDDPWCAHVAEMRAYADGEKAMPVGEARKDFDVARRALIDEQRAAAAAAQGVDLAQLDPYILLRKGMICEYLLGAEEERTELDWNTVDNFLKAARVVELSTVKPNDFAPIIPLYAFENDEEGVEGLERVNTANTEYCEVFSESGRILAQRAAPLVEELSFIGAVLRTPDWLAINHVAYHRWAREQEEGHQLNAGANEFGGGIPFHCRRFHRGFEILKSYAVKGNLIFLLPEFDDPERSGSLAITDAQGNTVVLDQVLAAAQLDDGGANAELIKFFAEDINASAGLRTAVENLNKVERPKQYLVFFETAESDPIADPARLRELGLDADLSNPPEKIAGIEELKNDLANARDPKIPLRIFITGHADCRGSASQNKRLSDDRAEAIFEDVIQPILADSGFTDVDFANKGLSRFRDTGKGETPLAPGQTCRDLDDRAKAFERRATVLVQ